MHHHYRHAMTRAPPPRANPRSDCTIVTDTTVTTTTTTLRHMHPLR